jgi:signal transduction histidine kinase
VLRVKNSVSEKAPDPERFFDRFFRADESRSRETGGNGIGLSAAQAIAQGHKGSIHAAYEGDAIVFTLALPLD